MGYGPLVKDGKPARTSMRQAPGARNHEPIAQSPLPVPNVRITVSQWGIHRRCGSLQCRDGARPNRRRSGRAKAPSPRRTEAMVRTMEPNRRPRRQPRRETSFRPEASAARHHPAARPNSSGEGDRGLITVSLTPHRFRSSPTALLWCRCIRHRRCEHLPPHHPRDTKRRFLQVRRKRRSASLPRRVGVRGRPRGGGLGSDHAAPERDG